MSIIFILVLVIWIIIGAIVIRIKSTDTTSACTHNCDQGRHCTCDKTTEKE